MAAPPGPCQLPCLGAWTLSSVHACATSWAYAGTTSFRTKKSTPGPETRRQLPPPSKSVGCSCSATWRAFPKILLPGGYSSTHPDPLPTAGAAPAAVHVFAGRLRLCRRYRATPPQGSPPIPTLLCLRPGHLPGDRLYGLSQAMRSKERRRRSLKDCTILCRRDLFVCC